MKKIFLILVIFMTISCTDNNDNNDSEPMLGVVMGTTIDVELKNSEGINLLDTDAYPSSNIVAKYLVQGKISPNTNPIGVILDHPDHVFLIDQNGIKQMSIALNHSDKEEFPITYVYWNKTEVDTIKAQYIRSGSSVILDKLWLFENNTWKELTEKPIIIVK